MASRGQTVQFAQHQEIQSFRQKNGELRPPAGPFRETTADADRAGE
jgi:hypothetical protein